MLRLYVIALQFLTIIPLPVSVRCEEDDLGRSMAVFPLVGLTLGGVLAGCDYLFSLVWPRGLVDLLLVAALALMTGALHLDGFTDVCDGIAARGGRERFLLVMKDSHIGAVGAAGLALLLLLKYQSLLGIGGNKTGALLFFPMVGRCCQVLFTVGSRRARQDGLGYVFVGGAGRLQLAVAAILTTAAGWMLLGLNGVTCLAFCFLVTLALKSWFHRRLGGITGDAIGCVNELSELLCLMILAAQVGGRLL